MIGQSIRQSFRPNSLPFQLIVVGSLGLLLGLASLRFSPLLVLGTLSAALFSYATLKRPEIALLGILVATSSIVFEEQLPMISLGISLHIPDFLLLGTLGLILVRWLAEPEFKIVRTPLDWPLLIFFGVTLVSTFIALHQSSVEIETARRAIRVMSYYLTFFIVTNLVREDHQLRFLLSGIFLLATIVAGAMIAQFLLGRSYSILPGRVEALQTQAANYDGVTRMLPPGQSLILVAFITLTCSLVLDKFTRITVLRFFQVGLLTTALLFTFTRGFWVQAGLALVILAYLVKGSERQRLVGHGLVVLLLASIVLLPIVDRPDSPVSQLIGASLERAATLGRGETLQESSLQYRAIENEYALPQITSHPLLGLGFGASYRPRDSRIDFAGEAANTGWIHNGHLWIMLATGLLGYASLIWLSLAFVIRGLGCWRLVCDSQMRAWVLGFTLTYLGVLIGAVVRPIFVLSFWTPVIGIMMGINEIILRRIGQQRSNETI